MRIVATTTAFIVGPPGLDFADKLAPSTSVKLQLWKSNQYKNKIKIATISSAQSGRQHPFSHT
jgi:hypothetical protein